MHVSIAVFETIVLNTWLKSLQHVLDCILQITLCETVYLCTYFLHIAAVFFCFFFCFFLGGFFWQS